MNDLHEPTPEFLAHLERETRFALRHPRNSGPRGLPPHLRTVALVLLALGAGAGCVVAAEHMQDSRRVEHELVGNQLRLEIAARRLTALRDRRAVVQSRFEAGVQSQSEVAEAERRLLAAERTFRHVELEREELDRGGHALPRAGASSVETELALSLSAPLVGGRDFVREHLLIDLETSARLLELARSDLERTTALWSNGSVSESVPARARAALVALERQVATLDQRLASRDAFAQGRTSREDCERADLQLAAQARHAEGEARIALLREEFDRAQRHAEAGVAPFPHELRLDLDEAESELALVELELEALR